MKPYPHAAIRHRMALAALDRTPQPSQSECRMIAVMETERERLLIAEAERDALARRNTQSIAGAVLAERERCARIAERWPDNLMAAHIAKAIRKA